MSAFETAWNVRDMALVADETRTSCWLSWRRGRPDELKIIKEGKKNHGVVLVVTLCSQEIPDWLDGLEERGSSLDLFEISSNHQEIHCVPFVSHFVSLWFMCHGFCLLDCERISWFDSFSGETTQMRVVPKVISYTRRPQISYVHS